MRSKCSLTLCTALLLLLGSGSAGAAWPSAAGPLNSGDAAASWHRLGRSFGIGWSDGYHACARRPHRLGDNLPPREFSSPRSVAQTMPICGHCAAAPAASAQASNEHQPDWGPSAAGRVPRGIEAPRLPPSVLESGAAEGNPEERGAPADRVSRASSVEAWKWIREPGAPGNR